MFKKVDPKMKFPEMEKEVLKFWEENKIFEKSVKKPAPVYSFYDGPPFATGSPHYGHLVGSIMKDAVPRYWTMRGFSVPRKWGWDCHGLPIENIAEKELGIKHKKEIEEMGVDKFNEFCRTKVLKYVDEWKIIINRLGRWADMENSYKTMDLSFMESVWWVFKELYNRGLIYEGYRSMYICPRCETTLSQSEVAEGYKDIKDISATVKFELIEKVGFIKLILQKLHVIKTKKTYILAWTTTPWTLIGNVALAMGKNLDYITLEAHENTKNLKKGEKIIFVFHREILLKILGKDYKEIHKSEKLPIKNIFSRIPEFYKTKNGDVYRTVGFKKGSDLINESYKPLFDYYVGKGLENEKNGWKIYGADFVTTEEGTGVVHIAPAFGEDDMNLGKKYKLPFIQHVGMDGIIKSEAKDFSGMSVVEMNKNVKKIDIAITNYLKENNFYFFSELHKHSYPHCWRCETPLINYATSSWFVNITKIKDEMLKNAKNINWIPEYLKEGRFGNWLEGARDWSISRQRFWASVIPIWKCDCGEIKVVGSVKELEELSEEKITDIHKHIVDKIAFKCKKCGGIMKRIPDVLDTWFDSGSMPYAQAHYPFENKENFDKNFPAEFIAEGVDQTRCWFYYLHVISAAIKKSNAFKNVVVNGIVLAEDGKKMSKRLKNYPDPAEIFDKYGADALRFYLLSSPVMSAETINFKESEVAELVRGMFRMLWNSYSFFVLYANIDKFNPATRNPQPATNLLDKWIVSELNMLVRDVNENMEKYELSKTVRLFPKFIDNLSNWYIRRSRKRFWKSENDGDKKEAYQTLYYVLVEISKLMAPFTPFIAEEIYKNLTGEESVHLAEFPKADGKLIDKKLNEEMNIARNIVSEGLQLRAKAKIKVRQPLSELLIKENIRAELLDVIKEEVNVKNIEVNKNQASNVILNIKITPELKLEGQAREIIRHIQEMRKEAGYEIDNRIIIGFEGMENVFKKFGELIAKEVLANKIKSGKIENSDLKKEFKIDGESLKIEILK